MGVEAMVDVFAQGQVEAAEMVYGRKIKNANQGVGAWMVGQLGTSLPILMKNIKSFGYPDREAQMNAKQIVGKPVAFDGATGWMMTLYEGLSDVLDDSQTADILMAMSFAAYILDQEADEFNGVSKSENMVTSFINEIEQSDDPLKLCKDRLSGLVNKVYGGEEIENGGMLNLVKPFVGFLKDKGFKKEVANSLVDELAVIWALECRSGRLWKTGKQEEALRDKLDDTGLMMVVKKTWAILMMSQVGGENVESPEKVMEGMNGLAAVIKIACWATRAADDANPGERQTDGERNLPNMYLATPKVRQNLANELGLSGEWLEENKIGKVPEYLQKLANLVHQKFVGYKEQNNNLTESQCLFLRCLEMETLVAVLVAGKMSDEGISEAMGAQKLNQ